jgi:hypothetical protein
MKTVLAAALVMLGLTAAAQKVEASEVPNVVSKGFRKVHPQARVTKWEKEDENFEAHFVSGGTEKSVLLDAEGGVLQTETVIQTNELPKAALEYVKSNYEGAKITEASKIVDNKGVITYEAELKKTDVVFDAEGKFLSEKKENKGDKD